MGAQRHAFVTGGTGFVGVNLIAELLELDWKVTALRRRTSSMRNLIFFDAAERVEGDITEIDSLMDVMPEGVDAVFHVAGNVNMWSRRNKAQTRDNVLGTRNMVQAALEKKAKCFVHTSSIAAYGLQNRTVDEGCAQEGSESSINYLRTKAVAELVVRNSVQQDGLPAVIMNPSNIVGPFDRTGWGLLVRKAARGWLPVVPPGRGSFCHVREVVRTHIAAVDKARRGENYLLGGADARYLEFVQIVREFAGRRKPRTTTPYLVLWLIARVASVVGAVSNKHPMMTPEAVKLASSNFTCRSDKAERELDYKPVPLREMLQDSYSWLREERILR